MWNRATPLSARLVRTVAVAVAVVAAVIPSGCGKGEPSARPSPEPARSVATMPALEDEDGHPTAAAARVVEVFLKDGLTRAQRKAMAAKIAAMPEVELYCYVSKKEALRRFTDKFGEQIVADLRQNPLPASFEILVRESDQVRPVARRFFDDPRVGNSPGTHDGVQYPAEEVRDAILSSPAP